MNENEHFDKKSLKLLISKNPDWKALARDCVCFANAKGGKIIIGIEDDCDMPPSGQKISKKLPEQILKRIEELTINVGIGVKIKTAGNNTEFIEINVLPSASTIASTSDGQYYIRIADNCKPVLPDELSRLFTDKSAFQWETKVVSKYYWNTCDQNKLKQFLTDIQNSQRVSDFVKQKSEEELLTYYQFIDSNGNLTNLGVLWLGTQQQRARLLYAPVVQFIKYNERGEKVRKEVWDDFTLNPKELIESIWHSLPEWKEGIEISDGILGRHIVYHYNETVVRELLANALVHRPYTTRGDIFINLFPNRLEIHNPGLLPLGVTPQNILHQSVKRNEHLSKVFYDLGLMEREGSGYDKIYEIQVSEAKPLPEVQEGNDRVSVTIYNQIKNPDVIRFIEEVKKRYHLTQKEIICLGIIAQHQSILATEFSRLLQSQNDKQIKNWLGNLLKYEIIKTKGRTKGTEYFVNPKILKNTGELKNTSLKYIQEHRLEALILTDIERFQPTKVSEIHQRIGKEIPLRKIKYILKKLKDDNKISQTGKTSGATYTIKQN
tara:strand:- start:11329 stop:12975 length:1647 start_codon:yes stop_codon:yes gene_type:complete